MKRNDNQDAAREFVRHAMSQGGLSRSALARDAGIDPKTLRGFLDGGRWPQQESRSAISKALGWSADEIDHIEQTGVHRFTVNVRDVETGRISSHESSVSRDDWKLTALFTGVVDFGAHIRDHYPPLAGRAHDLIQEAADLWRDANEDSRGGDGDAEDSGRGSAPNQEPASGPANQPDQNDYELIADEQEHSLEDEQVTDQP